MKKLIYLLVLVMMVSGCASSVIMNVRKNYTLNKRSGKSLVIGKIGVPRFDANLMELKLKNSKGKIYTLKISLKRKNPKSIFDLRLLPTYFFIELPKGDYKIYEVSSRGRITTTRGKSNVTFSVEPNKIIYVGTLEIYIIQKLDPSLVFYYDILFQKVINEKEEAVKELRKDYPNITEEVQVNLADVHKIAGKDYWPTFRSKKK